MVSRVLENSAPGSGIQSGDIILSLQGGTIDSKRDFKIKLAEILHYQSGICMSDEVISDLRQGTSACSPQLGTHVDFTQPESESVFCLPLRKVIEANRASVKETQSEFRRELLSVESLRFCNSSSTCLENSCLFPKFNSNQTRLIIMERLGIKEFLFLGSPAEIYQSVTVTDYSPRFPSLPPSFPDSLEKLMSLMASLSAGLAALNIVPSFMLDGGHIIKALVEILFRRKNAHIKEKIVNFFTIFGTLLISFNLVLGLWSAIKSS